MKGTHSAQVPWRVLGWLLASAALSGCSSLTQPVARTVDGVTSEGRFIEPDAYALYAVAALREASGKWHEALQLYQQALELDAQGPEIRTRIAAVACKLRKRAVADEAFASAMAKDDEYGPAWFELALCLKSRGDLSGAERASLRALTLDPERYETSLLAAELAALRGDHAAAWRLLDALATHAPHSLQVQRAVLNVAEQAGQRARAARAQQALAELSQVDARRLAPHGVTRALEALGRGDVAGARREAELVLGADPDSGDALVIALSAADLEQDHAGFARLLERRGEPSRPASPAVLGALEALLTRRVSAQAGQLVRQ